MRGGLGATVGMAVALLLGVGSASASTEVGNVCPANLVSANATMIQLGNVSSSLPIAVPTAGVATKWRVESLLANKPQVLKVVRPTGNKHEFRAVAESTEQTVLSGQNVFDTRIPVEPGDQFGLYGANPSGALYCNAAVGAKPMDVAGSIPINFRSTDAPAVFGEFNSIRVAVSAIVEPDADGDGFGDETQDKCPQSAAFQVPCPQVSIDALAVVGRSSVTLLVTADREAPVTVIAITGHRSKSARTARRGGPPRLVLAGGTQIVAPGKIVKFKLPFSAKLKSRLRALPRGHFLRLTITASTKNEAGQTSGRTTAVRLKGRG